VVELENFAVWYQKLLNFFQLGRPGLARQAGKLEAVFTEDELRVRAVEAKVRRGRRKEEEDGHGYRSRTTRLKAVIRPARFYGPLIFSHFAGPRHVCAFKAIAAAFYLHCGVYYYGEGLVLTAADNLILRSCR
jgi:hypothetical protein